MHGWLAHAQAHKRGDHFITDTLEHSHNHPKLPEALTWDQWRPGALSSGAGAAEVLGLMGPAGLLLAQGDAEDVAAAEAALASGAAVKQGARADAGP